ncbi:MAG: preprotein translocase subunit SecG [Pseudomonadota bacterium]
MTNVILVIHILAAVILTTVVLMQRSEGGALGIGGGGGGGGGGLMSGQGVKGALIRTTVVFGAIFFVTSLTLTTMATRNSPNQQQTNTGEGSATSESAFGVDPTTMGDLLEPSGPVIEDPTPADPLTSDPLSTDPVTTDPLTSDPLESDPLTTDPLVSDPLAEDPDETPQQ